MLILNGVFSNIKTVIQLKINLIHILFYFVFVCLFIIFKLNYLLCQLVVI